MTTVAKLKEYYLAFWLKPDKAETPIARFIWSVALASVSLGIFLPPLALTLFLADTFIADDKVSASVVVLATVLTLSGFAWFFTRPRKWQEERGSRVHRRPAGRPVRDAEPTDCERRRLRK